MKISMKVGLMSLVMLFAITAVNAQKKGGKLAEKVQVETDALVKALDLNEDVATKIYEISFNAAKASRAVAKEFKAGTIEKEEKKEKMKAIGKQKNEDIKALLDKKQKQAYVAYKKELKAAKKASKN